MPRHTGTSNIIQKLTLLLKMTKLYILFALLVFVPSRLDAVCPTGWETFQNNCYKKFPAKSWDEAITACEDEDAMLAEVTTQAENDFIENQFKERVWLGISRCHRTSTCLLDFTPALYTNWAAGEPNNEPQIPPGLDNKDFAVLLRADGKWDDRPKQESHPYICKKPDDPCKDNLCNPDGSKCEDGKCICDPGFSGEYCYVEPCDTDPCQNGGECKVVGAGYECTCIDFYSGKNCEVKPPCENKKPCDNGVCVNINSVDYKCNCEHGWLGKNCDERPCDRKPCVNFKECQNDGNKFKCICLPKWTGERCDKRGNAWGDPHYTTFDGKKYNFMGKCEYIYAKDCGEDHAFEVLQQNEPCGGGTVSCTKSARVIIEPHEFILQRSRVVYFDGQRVRLPWEKNGTTIIAYGRGALLSVPRLLISIAFDGSYYIEVNINQRYRGNMCGLMGNADGNPKNDFQLPDKTLAKTITEFGNSWKKNPRCVNGINPPDPCKKLSQTEYNAIKEKCGKMKKPPFKQCNAKITPDPQHIPDCEYDLCAMKENPSAAWCQALETYDESCTAKGTNIDWEGQAGFEECGSPCANVPCFNGAECKNLNRKEYKCTCPTGFTGPKCQDVVCKSGYRSRGNFCYRKMTRRPWKIARCRGGDQFVSTENEDENDFIYNEFVKKSNKMFWLNARVCGENKLCRNDFGVVYYHNVDGPIPKEGCVSMAPGNGGKWKTGPNCRLPMFYICKHEIF